MTLHLNRLESHSPKDAFCQVWLTFDQWLMRRRFLKFVTAFLLFCNNLLLEKGMALHLHQHKSLSPKDALCQVWLKLAQWFWRIRFLNYINEFLLFHNYLPVEKGMTLHLNKLEYCFGAENENVKSIQTEGQWEIRQETHRP